MSITAHINAKLEEQQKERLNRERSGKFSPSMFGKCYRAQFWNRKNEPATDLPQIPDIKRMILGNLIHDWVQSFYEPTQKEIKVETDDIRGFADIVLNDCVIDIKSQNDWAFKWHYKKGFDVFTEKPDYWLQVACYGALLKKKYIKLYFVNTKDVNKFHEYETETNRYIDILNDELSIIRNHWDKGDIPPAIPRLYGGKECDYCKWRTLCKEINGKEVQNEKTKEK